MTALAWPVVVLVLGLCAARICWVLVDRHRQSIDEVAGALDKLAAIVDIEIGHRVEHHGRLESLEETRRLHRNRNGGRD